MPQEFATPTGGLSLHQVYAQVQETRRRVVGQILDQQGAQVVNGPTANTPGNLQQLLSRVDVQAWIRRSAQQQVRKAFPGLLPAEVKQIAQEIAFNLWKNGPNYIAQRFDPSYGDLKPYLLNLIARLAKSKTSEFLTSDHHEQDAPDDDDLSIDDQNFALGSLPAAKSGDYRSLLKHIDNQIAQLRARGSSDMDSQVMLQRLLDFRDDVNTRADIYDPKPPVQQETTRKTPPIATTPPLQQMQHLNDNEPISTAPPPARVQRMPRSLGTTTISQEEADKRMEALKAAHEGLGNHLTDNAVLTARQRKQWDAQGKRFERFRLPLFFTRNIDNPDPTIARACSNVLVDAMNDAKLRLDAYWMRNVAQDGSAGPVKHEFLDECKPIIVEALINRLKPTGLPRSIQKQLVEYVEKANSRDLQFYLGSVDELRRFYQYERARHEIAPDTDFSALSDEQLAQIQDQAREHMGYGNGEPMHVRRLHPFPDKKNGVGALKRMDKDIARLRADTPEEVRKQIMMQELRNQRAGNLDWDLFAHLPYDSPYFTKRITPKADAIANPNEIIEMASTGPSAMCRIASAIDWLRYYAIEMEHTGAAREADSIDSLLIRTASLR